MKNKNMFKTLMAVTVISSMAVSMTACSSGEKDLSTVKEKQEEYVDTGETAKVGDASDASTDDYPEPEYMEDSSKNEKDKNAEAEDKQIPAEEPSYKASEYVELGKYIGIEIEPVNQEVISDEQVQERIRSGIKMLDLYKKSDKQVVENGDVVNINFEGKIDGKDFDGGTAEGYNLEVGSGSFINGFEEGLINAKVGDTLELNLKFPEDYYEDFAGKDVVFTVHVNSIMEMDDLTDENAAVLSGNMYNTAKEYENSVRMQMESEAKGFRDYILKDEANEALLNSCTIKGYPEDVLEYRIEHSLDAYRDYAAKSNEDLDTVLKNDFNTTIEQLRSDIEGQEKAKLASDMIIMAVAEKEGISISDEEFEKYVSEYAQRMYYADKEELFNDIGRDKVFKDALISKTLEYIIDNAKFVEGASDREGDDMDVIELTEEEANALEMADGVEIDSDND